MNINEHVLIYISIQNYHHLASLFGGSPQVMEMYHVSANTCQPITHGYRHILGDISVILLSFLMFLELQDRNTWHIQSPFLIQNHSATRDTSHITSHLCHTPTPSNPSNPSNPATQQTHPHPVRFPGLRADGLRETCEVLTTEDRALRTRQLGRWAQCTTSLVGKDGPENPANWWENMATQL